MFHDPKSEAGLQVKQWEYVHTEDEDEVAKLIVRWEANGWKLFSCMPVLLFTGAEGLMAKRRIRYYLLFFKEN